jgi:hypothetical protein
MRFKVIIAMVEQDRQDEVISSATQALPYLMPEEKASVNRRLFLVYKWINNGRYFCSL